MIKRFVSKKEKFAKYVTRGRWEVTNFTKQLRPLLNPQSLLDYVFLPLKEAFMNHVRIKPMNKKGTFAFNHGVFASTVTGVAPAADTVFSVIGQENILAAYKLKYNSLDFKSGNDGTDTSVTYGTAAPTNLSGSADYNGSSSVTTIGNMGINGQSQFSISMWINPDNVSTLQSLFEDTGVGAGTTALRIQADGKIFFKIARTSGETSTTGTTVLSTGTWYHIVGSYNGSSVQLYVNGSAEGTPGSTSAAMVSDGTSTFGRFDDSAALYYNGQMSQPVICSTGLNSTQVSDLYNSGDGVEMGDNDQDNLYADSLTTNLKAAYPFLRNANDHYGTNDGTVSGATLTAVNQGNLGYAYDFDGTNDQITTSAMALPATNGFSVSMWIKVDALSVDRIFYQDPNGGTGYNWNIGIDSGTSNRLFFGDNAGFVYSTSGISTGVWTHIVCTAATGASSFSDLKIYINGSDDTSATTAGTFNGVDGSAQIVRFASNNTSFFDGKIAMPCIWTTGLSAANVTTLYNSGNAISVGRPSLITNHGSLSTGAKGKWNFNTNANDSIGSNNGTVTGATNTTGFISNGYDFSGTAQYIALTNTILSLAEMQAGFTMNFWVKPDTLGKLMAAGSTGTTGINWQYYFDGTKTESSFFDGSSYVVTTSTLLSTSAWSMITWTYDGSGNHVFYINDVSEGTLSQTIGSTTGRPAAYTRFATDNLGTLPFDGLQDEWYVRTQGSTAGEAEVLYNLGDGLPYS